MSAGPRYSGPYGGRSCTSPGGAWSFASSLFRGGMISPENRKTTFRDHAVRIAPSSCSARWGRNRQVLRPMPAQTAGAKHRAGPMLLATLGPRSGRFLGGNPRSVKPRVESLLDQPEGGRGLSAGGENRHGRPGMIAGLARTQQIGDPPRDGRRRIDEIDRPWRELAQAVDQQRIVRAGKHDRIGAVAVIDEGRRDLFANGGVIDLGAGQIVFRVGRKLLGADQRDFAVAGVIANERTGIFARHRRFGTEH